MDLCVMRCTGAVLAFVALAAVLAGAARPPFQAVLSLERSVHLKEAGVQQLMAWDTARHERSGLLGRAQVTRSTGGVVQLPVSGSINNSYTGWWFRPYLTRVQIGNPPRNFTLLVDTGSDTMWISCTPCSGCPTTGLRQPYNPNLSSTSSVIACSDDWCQSSKQSGIASCDASDDRNHCGYNITYGSGQTVGYYVSDQINLDIIGDNVTSLSSTIIFGCSTMQSGGLAETNLEFDGLIGLGPNHDSLNSQLNSKEIAPLVFSLCLTTSGNGFLILGEAVEPGIVYTPLAPSNVFYMLYLESIAVNGQTLHINSSVFETSLDRGTIVDSGTTLAYLPDQAYDPFIDAIVAAVSPSVRPMVQNGEQCFITSSFASSSFPDATLHFAGGAVMAVKPQNYLLPEVNMVDGQSIFCLGWKRQLGSYQQITILGDIVIANKLIVHDLDNMRLGWVDYDCSQLVNVTTPHPWKRHASSGHGSDAMFIPAAVVIMLTTHLFIFGI